jgi:hypothetical protein
LFAPCSNPNSVASIFLDGTARCHRSYYSPEHREPRAPRGRHRRAATSLELRLRLVRAIASPIYARKLTAEGLRLLLGESEGGVGSIRRELAHTLATIPAGHVVKSVSTLKDAQGRMVQEWVKTREGTDPVAVVDAIKAAFDGYQGRHEPIPAPAAASADLVTLLPLADWHIGAHAWGRETGVDWDLKIAEEVIGRAVENVVERSPASGLGVVLGGGDLMHADNQDNRTARSSNQLDVDGRYPKVFDVASRLTVRTVDAMLRRTTGSSSGSSKGITTSTAPSRSPTSSTPGTATSPGSPSTSIRRCSGTPGSVG